MQCPAATTTALHARRQAQSRMGRGRQQKMQGHPRSHQEKACTPHTQVMQRPADKEHLPPQQTGRMLWLQEELSSGPCCLMPPAAALRQQWRLQHHQSVGQR